MRTRIALIILSLLALFGVAAPAAHADNFTNATLTVSPNPAVFTDQNAYFTFTGCGYDPNAGGVTIVVYGPTATSFFGGPTDANGCLGADGNGIVHNGFVSGPGTYDVQAVQEYQRGQTVHQVLRATATLVVTSG